MSPPDEPAFAAPWEASAFALKEALLDSGLLAPAEWAEALGRERAASAAAGEPEVLPDEPGTGYWRDAVRALERVLARKGALAPAAVAERRAAWREAAAATPHGEPIALSPAARAGD